MASDSSSQHPGWIESDRQAALDRYQILDSAAEAEFDDIVRIAALVCGAPIALISLLDNKRQWFKARLGLDAQETAREVAFCEHAIQDDGVFEVTDAHQDRRFVDNSLVTGDPHLRSYAGAPLITPDGYPLGTLCVLDRQPKQLSEAQRAALDALARQVIAQLELRRALIQQRADSQRHRLILESATDYAIISMDLGGNVATWNEGARQILGWTSSEICGSPCHRFFTPEDRVDGVPEKEMATALAMGRATDERWHLRKDGRRFWASGEMMPLHDDSGLVTGYLKMLRDRTEQHAAGVKLRQSEEQLRRAQKAGGIGTFSCDVETDLMEVSPGYCEIFGLPERAVVSAAECEALIVEEDRRLASNAFTRAQHLAPLTAEYRIRRANDGQVRSIARSAGFEFDEFGQASRLVGVVQDVTQQKASQRAAEDSARQFRALAEAMPNHVWTALPDGKLDWLNRRTYEYAGAHVIDLTGDAWTSIVHQDDLPSSTATWIAALGSGLDYETEFRLRDAAGHYRWHLARAVAIRDEAGSIVQWIGTNTDIHERKLAEAESERARNRIWRLSRELMLVCNFDGLITAVNPAATRLLGWEDEDMVGHQIPDFLHPDDLSSTEAELGKLSRGATILAFENRYRAKDGSYRVLNWAAVPEGELVHAVARDVTDERATEAALRQSQKMEAVGQLTGGLAHDFNNLLTGMSGSLELLQLRTSQGRLSESDRYISAAQGAVKRAAALTHRLLAFSRRQTLDPKPTDVKKLVFGMEELLQRTVGPSIKVEAVHAAGLWPTLIDPGQLENSILNLCINARDAMPDGGTITIESGNRWMDRRTAEQRGLEPGQYISLCVSDTGSGMPTAVIAKAFDPFFTTKPIGMGTGLGLSMVYGFAKQSGGSVNIYSEVGAGSMVCIYLPRHSGDRAIDPTEATVADVPRAGNGETVLVIDDEPTVRLFISEVLSDLGYATLEAGDGATGLKLLQSNARVDLLVTDVGLPGGMNGRQVADAARVFRPNLGVLFITGYAENAVLSHGHLDPGMHVLTKPFSMDSLGTRIRELLKQA